MTDAESSFVNATGPVERSSKPRGVLVVRRPAAVSLDEDTGYVFRVASLTKRVLEDLERTPGAVLPRQRACVINARRFVERAERGRHMLERTEAHFVSDIKAVGTYSSARRVLDTLDKNGATANYLEQTRNVLRRLERGESYADIDEHERKSAHSFFDTLSDVFGADVAAEAAGYRAIEHRETKYV